MKLFSLIIKVTVLATILYFVPSTCSAFTSPSPTPTPPGSESQERVKIFTEEVVIPVTVYDKSSHLMLGPEDILVFEDDVRQVVRSVRRLPANVLFLLDTGGDLNPAMRVSITKDIALRLISKLRTEHRIAIMQFGNRPELVQAWTDNRAELIRAVQTKLISGKHPQLTKALLAAASQLRAAPAGTRHLVLITDGVDLAHTPETLNEAVRQLLKSNITIHVIGYGSLGRKKIDQQNPLLKVTNEKRKSAQDLATEIMHPNVIPEYKRRNKIYLVVDTDITMRRKRSEYKEATKHSEMWLTALAQQTGGLVFVPQVAADMVLHSEDIAREINSQYVVTYSPKRPLLQASPEEYRRINVAASVSGIEVRARRGYVANGP